MNTHLCLKKFFSAFVFFDIATKIKKIENRHARREQVIRYRLAAANDTIKDLKSAVTDMERENQENMGTIKKRAQQMELLHQRLEATLKEKQECREQMAALQMTHTKLVKFLEQQSQCPSSK